MNGWLVLTSFALQSLDPKDACWRTRCAFWIRRRGPTPLQLQFHDRSYRWIRCASNVLHVHVPVKSSLTDFLKEHDRGKKTSMCSAKVRYGMATVCDDESGLSDL